MPSPKPHKRKRSARKPKMAGFIEMPTDGEARLRILPSRLGEVPGKEFHSLLHVPSGEETTSPRSFGRTCPIMDLLDELRRNGSAQGRRRFREHVGVRIEYWLPVIDRADMGTPENPNLFIFRAKSTVYQTIINYMLDEDDDGGDITHLSGGQDIHVRQEHDETGESWSVRFLECSLLSEEPAMQEALAEATEALDVRRFFPPTARHVLDRLLGAVNKGLDGTAH